jgi:hypothetical protein
MLISNLDLLVLRALNDGMEVPFIQNRQFRTAGEPATYPIIIEGNIIYRGLTQQVNHERGGGGVHLKLCDHWLSGMWMRRAYYTATAPSPDGRLVVHQQG